LQWSLCSRRFWHKNDLKQHIFHDHLNQVINRLLLATKRPAVQYPIQKTGFIPKPKPERAPEKCLWSCCSFNTDIAVGIIFSVHVLIAFHALALISALRLKRASERFSTNVVVLQPSDLNAGGKTRSILILPSTIMFFTAPDLMRGQLNEMGSYLLQ
jgi:hypothetical protein